MGKSAKVAKRPGRKPAADNPDAPSSSAKSSSSSSSKPLKKSFAPPTLSKTSNNPIAKPKPTAPKPPTAPAAKLGKNEISIERPDYIDLFSGRKTFQRQVREKVLLKGVPQGTRVVSASAVAAAVQNAKKAAAAGGKAGHGKRGNVESMDWS